MMRKTVDAVDERGMVEQSVKAGSFDGDGAMTEALFDGADIAFQHLAAAIDQADFIAQLFSLFHQVRGKDDRAIAAFQILDDFLELFAVGKASRTIYETVEIILTREAGDRFHIEVWRSFAPWLWTALTTAAGH